MKSERISWLTKPRVRWSLFLVVMSGLAGMSQPAHAKRTGRDTASVSSAKKDRQERSQRKRKGASVKRSAKKYLSVCRDWLVAVREKAKAFSRTVFSPVRWLFEWVCGVLPQPWSDGLRRVVRKIGEHGKLILFVGLVLLSGWVLRRQAGEQSDDSLELSKSFTDYVRGLSDGEFVIKYAERRLQSPPSDIQKKINGFWFGEAQRRLGLLGADDTSSEAQALRKMLGLPELQGDAIPPPDEQDSAAGKSAEEVAADTLRGLEAALKTKQGNLEVLKVVGEEYDRPLQKARCVWKYWTDEFERGGGEDLMEGVQQQIGERISARVAAATSVLQEAAEAWIEAHGRKLSQEAAAEEDLGKRVTLYNKALAELNEVKAWMPPSIWAPFQKYESDLRSKAQRAATEKANAEKKSEDGEEEKGDDDGSNLTAVHDIGAARQSPEAVAGQSLQALEQELQAAIRQLEIVEVVGLARDKPLQVARYAWKYWTNQYESLGDEYSAAAKTAIYKGISERLVALLPRLQEAAKAWEEAHYSKLIGNLGSAKDAPGRLQLYKQALVEVEAIRNGMPDSIWQDREVRLEAYTTHLNKKIRDLEKKAVDAKSKAEEKVASPKKLKKKKVQGKQGVGANKGSRDTFQKAGRALASLQKWLASANKQGAGGPSKSELKSAAKKWQKAHENYLKELASTSEEPLQLYTQALGEVEAIEGWMPSDIWKDKDVPLLKHKEYLKRQIQALESETDQKLP